MVSTPISPSRQNGTIFPMTGPITAAPSQLAPRPHLGPQPDLQSWVQYLRQSLAPLVSCMSGEAPADFPATLLSYNLLTHEQLDNLAYFFHQTSPAMRETPYYPLPMDKPWIGARAEQGVSLATKRRRFGRFIGLQNCETPIEGQGLFFEKPGSEPQQINFGTSPPPMELDDSILSTIISDILADSQASVQMLEDMTHTWQAALARAQAEQCHSYGWK
ncbi:hypothetical protein N7456_008335 [Penicillium angulare]|uniref:Uncharacterized protein n=1 Tax=Penicillium angulare TaxID=116970 RepID=A0A9W9FCG5_9EURO|nr:hypothetical protein N7456_008335 [Penicillium angulare]